MGPLVFLGRDDRFVHTILKEYNISNKMRLFVTPHKDASFTLQVINDQYNSFFRAVATALFYNRTGHNLGFGAPLSDREDEEFDPIEVHDTPNHYVQECLANWLEVYVGQTMAKEPVQRFSKKVMRGDFSSIENDGKTIPPLEAVLAFLEDWYAGACLEFASGSLDKRKFDELFDSYRETVLSFLSPADSGSMDALRDTAHDADYKDRVRFLNEMFQDQLKEPVTLFLMRPTSDARPVERRVVHSTADSNLVPVAPDVNRYESDIVAAYHDTVATRYPDVDDPLEMFRSDSLFIVQSEEGDTFHTLFSLVGESPRFRNRNYCGRVTRSILEDIFPRADINSILRTLYGGEVTSNEVTYTREEEPSTRDRSSASGDTSDTVRSSDPSNAFVASSVGAKFNYHEPSESEETPTLFFTDSNWEKAEDDIIKVLNFHEDVRIVRDGKNNTFVAELGESDANPLYRLDGGKGGYTVSEVRNNKGLRDPQVLTDLPMVTLVFSAMEIVSLVLGSSDATRGAMGRLIDRAKNVKGEDLLLQTIEKHGKVRGMGSLHDVNVASLQFEPYSWFQDDVQEAVRVVDDHTRYNPCLQLDSFAFVLAERNKDKERDEDQLRFKHVYELEYGDNKVTRSHAWKRFQVDRDQIPMASSSPHKALLWNLGQLDLVRQFGSENVKNAYLSILESANALRYSDPEAEAAFDQDLQRVAENVWSYE